MACEQDSLSRLAKKPRNTLDVTPSGLQLNLKLFFCVVATLVIIKKTPMKNDSLFISVFAGRYDSILNYRNYRLRTGTQLILSLYA